MADAADVANDYMAGAISSALEDIRSKVSIGSGSPQCSICGDDIPLARRKLGFQICLSCAEENERNESLFA